MFPFGKEGRIRETQALTSGLDDKASWRHACLCEMFTVNFLCLLSFKKLLSSGQFSSVTQSCPTLCNPMNCSTPGLPRPSSTPGVHSNSRPLSQWCHPAISSSLVPFSSCPQSLPASESFPMSQLFAWGGQSTGVSALASFFPKNTQDWSPLEWTGWIPLQSMGLSRVFSNIQFFIFFSILFYYRILTIVPYAIQ